MALNLDRLRHVAARVRAVADPIRTTSITIRTRTYPRQLGRDVPTTSDLSLGVLPVRLVSAKEVRDSGGRFKEGAVVVGPITPNYTGGGGGGFTIAQLTAVGSALQEIVWMLSGGLTGEYRLVQFESDKPLRYMVILDRMRTTP